MKRVTTFRCSSVVMRRLAVLAPDWKLASLSSRDGSAPCFDQKTSDVVSCPTCRQLVEYLVGEGWVAGQLAQNRLDVGLANPHQAAVGAVHRGQRIDDDLQLRCDQSGVVASEQPMGGLFEHAALAAPTAVEFGFRAATETSVDAQPCKQPVRERGSQISAVRCLDGPIVNGCEHFHLMQLATVVCR